MKIGHIITAEGVFQKNKYLKKTVKQHATINHVIQKHINQKKVKR